MTLNKLACITCLLIALVGLPLVLLLVIPPWQNQFASAGHRWLWNVTGVQLHPLEGYTGQVRTWDSEGRLRHEQPLRDGEPHGVWIDYDETGRIVRQSEYKHGEPWDGVCYIFAGKSFLGEYKAGRPWNGCLPTAKIGQPWQCYIDGVEVSEEAYRDHHQISATAQLIGLGYWEPEEGEDHGVKAP